MKAFTAHNTSETVRLNQLHKDCHQRVKYQKVCPEHGELQQTDIVSGYEFAKDEYVVIGCHLDHLGTRRGRINPGAALDWDRDRRRPDALDTPLGRR